MASPGFSGRDFGGGPERPSPACARLPAEPAPAAGALPGFGASRFDANGTDEQGCPFLHIASGLGDAESVATLLALGADPRARGPNGATALHCAAEALSEDCAMLLLEAGADPSAKDDFATTPLDVASLAARFALLGREPTSLPALLAAWVERTELYEALAPARAEAPRGL